jgi:hypothetical protein
MLLRLSVTLISVLLLPFLARRFGILGIVNPIRLHFSLAFCMNNSFSSSDPVTLSSRHQQVGCCLGAMDTARHAIGFHSSCSIDGVTEELEASLDTACFKKKEGKQKTDIRNVG